MRWMNGGVDGVYDERNNDRKDNDCCDDNGGNGRYWTNDHGDGLGGRGGDPIVRSRKRTTTGSYSRSEIHVAVIWSCSCHCPPSCFVEVDIRSNINCSKYILLYFTISVI